MNQRWRRNDGGVETLREIVTDGVTAKTAVQEGTSVKYALLQGRSLLRVSKATGDYLDPVPDERTPATVAYQKASAAQERLNRSARFAPEYKREKARVEQLYAQAQRLREQETAERNARDGTPEERDRRRRETQAARERAATITP